MDGKPAEGTHNPTPPKSFGNGKCCARADEEICDKVSLIGRNQKNSLQEFFWLLSRVAGDLTTMWLNSGDICPDVLKRDTGHFVEIAFLTGHRARTCLDDTSFAV